MRENDGAVVRKKSASKAPTATRWFRPFVAALIGIGLLSAPTLVKVRAQSQSTEDAVRGVLTAQQTAWNAGDVVAFMSGYQSSDATTFVGATITRGFRQVLENYRRRYPTKEKMGRLTFSAIEVTPLGAEFASVIGRFHLDRTAEAGGAANGIFTLLFRKTASGWKIILDHTS
jgi:ketosteroid isomerase-like protein